MHGLSACDIVHRVEMTFATARLAKCCSSYEQMVREFGPEMARRLGARLHEIEAAMTLAELRTLPQTRAHELHGDRKGQVSLDLVHPRRLILRPTEPTSRTADGGLDWEATTSIVILEITDTHR